ncbi:WYL domain-containing protein [Streptomyces xanthochromogenes]|uniref:WYL domain-containing protein n=1 Tax=Streptomyces xanthochromogenes TaxID=67384 RepID=UPI00343E9ED6
MYYPNRQSTEKTLRHLCRAVKNQHAVTITYLDRDDTISVRTIELDTIRTTRAGDIVLRAMCRLRGQGRSFALSRIISYTCHRTAYVLEHTEATTPAGQPTEPRSVAAVIAHELGRDYLPGRRTSTALAA